MEFIIKSICWTSLIVNILVLLTAAEVEDPSSASSSLRFFLGPMAASAVELAARFRITSSSSCCSLWKRDKTHKITYSMKIDQSKLNSWELSTFIFTVKQLGNANKNLEDALMSHYLLIVCTGSNIFESERWNKNLMLLHCKKSSSLTCFAFSLSLACSGSSCLDRLC